MPNYCNNSLYIEGSSDTMKNVIDFVKSSECAFDFDKIVPMPDNIYQGSLGPKERELYGKNNWYDWSIENWGTKWNSVDAELDGDEIRFLTAWSPCDPVIAALAEMFPMMRFTYNFYETGMCFCGERIYENGKLVLYYDGDYAENPLYEEDDEWAREYVLSDFLFPIKESGFLEAVENVEEIGDITRGNLHYREYNYNRISKMTDGFFISVKDYATRFANLPTVSALQVA